MMRALLSALLFLSSGPAAQAANDIAQIQQGLDSPVIVDVRSEGEYASGAIDGALNHPLPVSYTHLTLPTTTIV